MAATAAYLNDQMIEWFGADDPELLVLTNGGDTGATTIDETVLTTACGKAIRLFEARFTDYDPDTYGTHLDAAQNLTLQVLHGRAKNQKRVMELEQELAPLIPQLGRRSLAPVTNSTLAPTTPTSGQKPVFDDNHFIGIRVSSGNKDDNNTITP